MFSSSGKERRRAGVTLGVLAAVLLLTSCEQNGLLDPLEGAESVGGSSVTILKIAPKDGRLVVDWSPYEGEDFVSYDLYEISGDKRILRYATDQPSKVSWTDSVFVGGMVSYELVVRTTGEAKATSEQMYAAKAAAILDVELTETYRARLRWSPGDFGENVSRFGVHRASEGLATHLTEVLDAGETSFVDLSAVFGQSYDYRLISYNSEGAGLPSESVAFRVGGSGHPFQSLGYAHSTGSYYVLWQNVLRRIDAGTHEILAEYTGSDAPQGWIRTFSITPEGNGLYVAEGTNIVQLDPHTMDVQKSVSLQALLGYEAIPYQLSVSDDGTALVYTYRYESPSYYSDALVLVDVADGELRRRQTSLDGVSDMELSADGEHVLMGNVWLDVWRVTQDEFLRVATQVGRSDFTCTMDGGARFVTTDDGHISVFNTATQVLEKRYPIDTNLWWPAVDPVSGYLGGYERRGQWYVLYDLGTGQEVDRVEVVANREYALANRTLFSNYGHYLRLDLE